MNSLSGAPQRQHSTPPAPRRGSSSATGGSSARGVQLTVERERVPRLDRRHLQCAGGAGVELFGRLRHDVAMLTSAIWIRRARSLDGSPPHPAATQRHRRLRIVLPDHRRLNGRTRPREGRPRGSDRRIRVPAPGWGSPRPLASVATAGEAEASPRRPLDSERGAPPVTRGAPRAELRPLSGVGHGVDARLRDGDRSARLRGARLRRCHGPWNRAARARDPDRDLPPPRRRLRRPAAAPRDPRRLRPR